jgi:hypothetical protein
MVLGKTGNLNFDIAVTKCEAARQAAVLTAITQADYNALDLQFYVCVVAAGVANGMNTPNEVQAVQRLSRGQTT